jgi:hypothetical protein
VTVGIFSFLNATHQILMVLEDVLVEAFSLNPRFCRFTSTDIAGKVVLAADADDLSERFRKFRFSDDKTKEDINQRMKD